jgi:tRNA nucleotidyltransferase/poly(A) polymerase
MGLKTFHDYKLLRESDEKKSDSKDDGVSSKVTLGDNNDFPPFEISDDPKSEHYGKNKNLSPIVRAFKQGANWGWSRDDASGNDKPVKISGKKLYLAGGAVRDHLMGRKPRNVELATNASPDEVYHLLKQNGFEFINDKGKTDKGKSSPNRKEGNKQYFWVKKQNKNGRPFTFGLQVNEDEYDLEVFVKSPHGMVEGDPEPGTHAQDAAGRDFTINGMYILLSNDNGPNKELHDFYGGMHHLKSQKIASIGDLGGKLKEDPSRILRYARMLSQYGDPKKVPEEEKETVRKSASHLSKMDRKVAMDEFKKGMDKDGVDSRSFLKIHHDLGLLDSLFPGKFLDTDFPKELSELGDKQMPIAWMLRMNDPESLEDLGLDKSDLQKVAFLIKSLGMNENMDENGLSDLMNGYLSSGVSSRKLREFATKIGGLDGSVVDAFLSHAKGPRVKVHVVGDDGNEQVSHDFMDLIDPFTGSPKDHRQIDERRKQMELDNFKRQCKYMRPI